MPYLEILAPTASAARKQALVTAVTDGIVAAFGVSPATVTIYFLPIADADYGHEGRLGASDGGPRVFAKLHAYRRELPARRAAASVLTEAIAACFDMPSHNVAVYFMDRALDEVAHDGHMACDES
jgi:phenylpyruvate tautomerase PptA (4-oxalocrotonate tautomerase family)